MCNCNPITPCSGCCQQGVPCNCPPSYPVPNSIVPCNCCPAGYTYTGVSANFPNGYCTDIATGTKQIATIPCVPCAEITTTDCTVYSGQSPLLCNPSGINPGDTMTTIINKLCFTSVQNIQAMLSAIANSPQLSQALCSINSNCGSVGNTTPIIGSISWSLP